MKARLIPTLCIALASFLAQGHAATPAVSAESQELENGRAVYQQHCAACHGVDGDGSGPAAVWLFPRPRNFAAGLFKIKSTPGMALPTDADLLATVTRGMPGSSMPSFTYLTETERKDAVAYIKHLTAYTDAAGQRVNHFEDALEEGLAASPVQVPPEPPATVAALAEGARLFSKLLCVTCHGETGAGDGPNASTLKDTQGLYLPPRDFNTGAFRGGHTGRDLYLRIATGMPGTPMVAFGPEMMTDEERWSVVHYIQSLRRKDVEINDILAPTDDLVRAPRVVNEVPTDPMDPFWDSMDPVRVSLNPLWPEENVIYAVAVRAVHDGRRLAIQCTWKDPIADGAPVRVQDFQDALALQFAINGDIPFIGMGDTNNPVNLWQWKAGWQQEIDGSRQDMRDRYAAMHVDTYFETSYRTATDAGNLLSASHRSPVEDANASGFGTLMSQPPSEQNVNGKGLWRDGSWSVIFVRDLAPGQPADVVFVPGKATPVALGVWDGQNRDRNGRKTISNWHKLLLAP